MTDTLVIAPGDVVTLKSGGPAMTVEGLHAAPHNVSELIKQTGQMARVAWADAGGMVQQSQFWLHMLVKKADNKDQPAPRMPAGWQGLPPASLDPNRDRPDNRFARTDGQPVPQGEPGPVFEPAPKVSVPAHDDDREQD